MESRSFIYFNKLSLYFSSIEINILICLLLLPCVCQCSHEAIRPRFFLARLHAFRANDGTEVAPESFQSVGRNLVLHVVSTRWRRSRVFYLALKAPAIFPVHTLGSGGTRRTLSHRSHCHYSATPLVNKSEKLQDFDLNDDALPGVVSLCKGFVEGTLPINATHFGHIRPTGHSLRAGNGFNWLLYQINLYPVRASRRQSDRLDVEYTVLRSRLSAAAPAKIFWKLGGNELLRRKRAAPSELRAIRLDLSRPVLTGGGPFLFLLYIIADNGFYKSHKSNEPAVVDAVQSIISVVNNMYRKLDVHIIITGLEIHSQTVPGYDFSNPRNNDVSATLTLLKQYSRRIDSEYDCLHLLNGRDYYGSTAGLASLGMICNRPECAALSVSRNSAGPTATGLVMVHELAHNLGVEHNDEYPGDKCTCPTGACVMNRNTRSSSNWRDISWSKCSIEKLRSFLDSGFRHCLMVPRPEAADWDGLRVPVAANLPVANCGNGLLEPGEACDCGGEDGCRDGNACCHAATCQLAANATCAAGRCCDLALCRPRQAGSVCRSAKGDCDLAEFCDGAGPACPADVTARDGTQCGSNFCAGGVCGSALAQCKLLWGPGANTAKSWCPGGDEPHCGDLWCTDVRHDSHPTSGPGAFCPGVRFTHGKFCARVHCNYNSQLRSPGQVPDGAKCGPASDEKMCRRGTCLSAPAVRSEAEGGGAAVQCHNGGVVNFRGHCHCPPGFAPPDCLAPGNGGSVDSGPPQSDSRRRLRLGVVATIVMVSILGVAAAAGLAFILLAPARYKDQCRRPLQLLSSRRTRTRAAAPPPPSQRTKRNQNIWPPVAAVASADSDGGAAAVVRITTRPYLPEKILPTQKLVTPMPVTPKPVILKPVIQSPLTQKPPTPKPPTPKPPTPKPPTPKSPTPKPPTPKPPTPKPLTPKPPLPMPKSAAAAVTAAAQPLSVHTLVQQYHGSTNSVGGGGGGGGGPRLPPGARQLPMPALAKSKFQPR